MSSTLALPLTYGLLTPVFDPGSRDRAAGAIKSPQTGLANDQRSNKQRQQIVTQQFRRQPSSSQLSDHQGNNKHKQLKLTEIYPITKSKSAAINLYVSNTRLELLDKPALAGIDIYV